MNSLKKILGIFFIILVVTTILPAVPCFAASATVDITADHTEVTVGDTVKVYLNIDSSADFGDFEADLTYNKSILKYTDGASVITGGSGYLKISDMGKDQFDTSRKYALEFMALKVGECNLAFDGQVMVYDDAGNGMSVSSDSLTITVKAQETASTNTSLKSLETSPADITPAFDKNVHEYSVKVSNETQKLIINAVPEDQKANVSISGNEFLLEGENKIIITVLAESGDDIEYTIKAFREPAPTVAATPTAAAESNEVAFELLQSNGETYAVINGRFKLVEPGEEVTVPEGYSMRNVTVSGVTINAFVPDNDPESDFILLYAQTTDGSAGFYQYDRMQGTLQRYTGDQVGADQYRINMNRAAITIAILSAVSALLLAAVIWLLLKRRHNTRDEE